VRARIWAFGMSRRSTAEPRWVRCRAARKARAAVRADERRKRPNICCLDDTDPITADIESDARR